MREHHLALGDLGDSLLHGISRYETIYHYFVGLTNSVGSTESLYVVVRIPVGIVYYHSVGGRQINTETSGSGRQKKNELLSTCESSTGLSVQFY